MRYSKSWFGVLCIVVCSLCFVMMSENDGAPKQNEVADGSG